ncbi:MAG: DUF4011 domain-containing protein [Planctomycetota bacterium]|nr:MAG: DUF4011 domain-containing protein [Planctomycetota bacterium]
MGVFPGKHRRIMTESLPPVSPDSQSELPLQAGKLQLQADLDQRLNYALQQNAVPLVRQLRLENLGQQEYENLSVHLWLESELSERLELRISGLAPGEVYHLDRVDLELRPERLLQQQERESTRLLGEVRTEDSILTEQSWPVEVLACNEWAGLRSLPEMIAAFVAPNHPVVMEVLQRASRYLEEQTGDGGFNGYQSNHPRRIGEVAAAIYAALQDAELKYVMPPASFEEEGQKIRGPEEIMHSRMGCCLDLSALFAACLEQAGIHPLLVFIRGHAMVAWWTRPDSFPEPAMEDGLRLRKRVDLEEIQILETTAFTSEEPVSFPRACELARKRIQDPEAFQCAVDLHAARKRQIRPLPLRVSQEEFHFLNQDLADRKVQWQEPPAHKVPITLEAEEEPKEPEIEFEEEIHSASHERLRRWKRRLLDLSLRNRLINFRETKKSIPLLCADLAGLEDALASGRRFQLAAKPDFLGESDPRDPQLHLAQTGEDALENFLQEELAESRLHSRLGEEGLNQRLTELYRAARLSMEESGANTLYLALGFLLWTDPGDDKIRRAPILLLPLQLDRLSVREGFRLSLADDEPRINVTLLEKLRSEFGLDVSSLRELPLDEAGLDLRKILNGFRRAVRDLDPWDVEEQACIGLFSFTKFLMWLDLEERSDALMQNQAVRFLVERPEEAFDGDSPFPKLEDLDQTKKPDELYCPREADSSQLAAILAAEEGKSFVLEGPPGTGKSQTITNMIAQCLGQGKRVLFVAEKMAALNVVRKRLEGIGLGPFCLELHSNKSSKRQVLEQLEESLKAKPGKGASRWQAEGRKLAALREELNALVHTLHQPREFEESVYEVTAKLIGMAGEREAIPQFEHDGSVNFEVLQELRESLDQLATAAGSLGDLANHPLKAIGLSSWETALPDQFVEKIDGVQGHLKEAIPHLQASLSSLAWSSADDAPENAAKLSQQQCRNLTSFVQLLLDSPNPPRSLLTEPGWDQIQDKLRHWISEGRRLQEMKTGILQRWKDTALQLDPQEWISELEKAQNAFAPLGWLAKRKLKKEILPYRRQSTLPEEAKLASELRELLHFQEQEKNLLDPYGEAKRLFGEAWPAKGGDWSVLDHLIHWCGEFRSIIIRLGGEDSDLRHRLRERGLSLALEERDLLARQAPLGDRFRQCLQSWTRFEQSRDALLEFAEADPCQAYGEDGEAHYLPTVEQTLLLWKEHRSELRDWCHWRRVRDKAMANQLAGIVQGCEAGDFPPEDLDSAFEEAFYDWWLRGFTDREERLRNFNRSEQERRIQQFRHLDKQHLERSQSFLRRQLAERVPKTGDAASPNSEVGILLKELRKKRRHMPIRKLFQKLPNLLPRLKPCVLMSPLSASQYLDAGFPHFDLVVFDEASQIPVWDAVGSMARGKQVVVVGDSKQLPPTSFFQRVEDDDLMEDDDLEELESLLDECVAAQIPSMSLQWHYRSRHESLIAFSNSHYYRNQLFTFPSPSEGRSQAGVDLRWIEGGVYDRGKSRTNQKEAEAVVEEILQRLAQGKKAPSIGVVTLSMAQQLLVEDLLDKARRKNPRLDRFFGPEVEEPVFVKNLENVQGDERDLILLSVGYGPDANGKVYMNFGPLGWDGGERRLNVAITRAREQVLVFSSLRADQIDLARTRSIGVQHLKTYLEYAERGPQAIAESTGKESRAALESPFESKVLQGLKEQGWPADAQVGCSGFRIDLAIRDPKQPDRYLIGLLCDGENYRRAHTARDRERLRESVLEGLGWRLHRLWSADWWQNPAKEWRRLLSLLEKTAAGEPDPTESAAADLPDEILPEEIKRQEMVSAGEEPEDSAQAETEGQRYASALPQVEETEIPAPSPDPPTAKAKPYRRLELPTMEGAEKELQEKFYEQGSGSRLQRDFLRLLAKEGPLHQDIAYRRLAAVWTFGRLTGKARRRIQKMVDALPEEDQPIYKEDFLWPARANPEDYRFFRTPPEEDPNPRTAGEIPPEEVANAAEYVLQQNLSLPAADLAKETARVFGFASMGRRVQEAMEDGLRLLVHHGRARQEGEQISLPEDR